MRFWSLSLATRRKEGTRKRRALQIEELEPRLGVDPAKQNMSNVGRPIRLVDLGARAVSEIIG